MAELYAVPLDWQAHPDLLPALLVWVEGARRVAQARLGEGQK